MHPEKLIACTYIQSDQSFCYPHDILQTSILPWNKMSPIIQHGLTLVLTGQKNPKAGFLVT